MKWEPLIVDIKSSSLVLSVILEIFFNTLEAFLNSFGIGKFLPKLKCLMGGAEQKKKKLKKLLFN